MNRQILAVVMGLTMMGGIASAAELPKALVDPFLQLHDTLAADKFDGVADQAKAIAAAAAPLGKDADAIVAGARKLEAARNLEAARTAFGETSAALVAYAEKTKSELGEGIRIAYCPMVDKPWLQKDKEIKNPYYGSSMLTCGSFKK